MTLDTQYLQQCINKLGKVFILLQRCDGEKDPLYDIYRSAVIKEFEIILEQAGKMLKKCLVPHFHTHKAVDRLTFKNIFRHAGQHGLITIEEVERWLNYRDNRNETAHDYGECLANNTLPLIQPFIQDAERIIEVIKQQK